MTDQAEKFKPKEATPLDSKVREASEVETQEAGLHNEENKKIHDQTQARHKIGHSATDLMIPNQSSGPSLEMVDEEAGYVLTGKGYKPLVPEDISKTYKAILQDIPEVEDPALLPDKVAEATIDYYRAKGMIPDEATSGLEDLQQQCSYNPDDPSNGSDSLPAMTEDEAVYYRVHKQPGQTLIEGGIEHQNQVNESAGAPLQNPWQALLKLTPEQRQKFIESMNNAGSVAEESINETSDDILRKTAQGYIDTAVGLVKFPIDVAVAAGKGLWCILEFERDLMVNPQRAQETAATAGDSIGKALVAGIKLWAAGSEYGSEIQQKGDYGQPFQDLGNAINKWYDGLTPGDQMHAMATISAGFGLNAAAGQLRQLAKPGAFVQFMEEAAKAVPNNPEAQQKATDAVRNVIQSFSKSQKLTPVLETGVIEARGTGLGDQIDRASKALKDKFDELYNKMTAHKPESEGGKRKWDATRDTHETDIPAPKSLDNIQARDWYNARVSEIEDFERQMRQAGSSSAEVFDTTFDLRTQAKLQARDLMKDREAVKKLPPIPTKDEILAKYGGDFEKAIEGSKRTNRDVNRIIEELRKKKDSGA